MNLCKCGCGKGCNNIYANGHNRPWKDKTLSQQHKYNIKIARNKQIITEQTKEKISKKLMGRTSPMKGKNHSEEAKEKIRLAGKERIKNGFRSSFYIDGRTPLVKMIRNLSLMKQWTKRIFERDNYTCVECGRKNCYLNAHHTKSFRLIFEEFIQKYNNFSITEDKETLAKLAESFHPFWEAEGKTLCEECHDLTKQGRPQKCHV